MYFGKRVLIFRMSPSAMDGMHGVVSRVAMALRNQSASYPRSRSIGLALSRAFVTCSPESMRL